MASDGLFYCLSLEGKFEPLRQRQLEWVPAGYSAAFRSGASLNPFAKGNQSGSRQGKLLLQQQNIKKKELSAQMQRVDSSKQKNVRLYTLSNYQSAYRDMSFGTLSATAP